jgi:hypothetical protein
MTMINEASRVRFYHKLAETLGVEEAALLMTLRMGPGSDLATRDDLDAIEARIGRRLAEVESRVDRRLLELDGRIARPNG